MMRASSGKKLSKFLSRPRRKQRDGRPTRRDRSNIVVARFLDMPRRIAQERVPTASNVGSRDVTWASQPTPLQSSGSPTPRPAPFVVAATPRCGLCCLARHLQFGRIRSRLRKVRKVFFSLFGYDRVFPLLTLESLDDPYDPKDRSAEPDNEP